MIIEDYLHAVNQTYEIKLRRQGFSNITKEQVLFQGKNGIIEIWKQFGTNMAKMIGVNLKRKKFVDIFVEKLPWGKQAF